jgi:hypothetical protein
MVAQLAAKKCRKRKARWAAVRSAAGRFVCSRKRSCTDPEASSLSWIRREGVRLNVALTVGKRSARNAMSKYALVACSRTQGMLADPATGSV